ncbi:putative phospholipase B-like 2 [Dendronephthya gigantea]|uniref:putative phospholipase B-like 2 n=1 Tax=Dendronephthya gigantea TaxID=151771 RepID=UPI00106C1E33|nr:putative phospholipase B-like 2 [Dendronephthya gigantea]
MKGYFVFACLFLVHFAGADEALYASVVWDPLSNHLYVEDAVLPDAVAWGRFSNEVNKTGWSYLEVHTTRGYPDDIQSLAAGMVEGYLTADFILMNWKNTDSGYCKAKPTICTKLNSFLYKNSVFVTSQIESNLQDPYWYQVKLLYQQLLGLRRGYAASETGTNNPLSSFDFHLMQLGGVSDLEQALNGTTKRQMAGDGSCSAFIKILPKNEDLLISQVTWNSYTSMLRIYKLYELQLVNNSNPALHIVAQNHSFSSYPGRLYSGDDFYVLSSGLVTQETTNDNYNKDLWQYIGPNSVMEWARTVIANRLAQDGQQWVSLFAKHNSGTYNNQWMVLNYNMFTPGKPVIPETLWVLEQMPGIVQMGDLSLYLINNGYWASYNIPFFDTIFTVSGQEDMVKKYGSWFDYELNPRAQIFKRDQSKVVDLASMMKLMRYNDYTHDPLSKCNCTPPYSAENAISSRSDLNPASGKYPFPALGHREHGGTDAKITSYKLFQDFTVYAVSGPTHDQQPVFNWTMSGWSRPLGHPDNWDFEPVMISWSGTQAFEDDSENLLDLEKEA